MHSQDTTSEKLVKREAYGRFLKSKVVSAKTRGLAAVTRESLNPKLKPHQKDIALWAIHGGNRAIFANFGLGKTVIQLQILISILEHCAPTDAGLIVCPLGVKGEFVRDAKKFFNRHIQYVRTAAELETYRAAGQRLFVTNYERVRDGDLDPNLFQVVSLDEAACFAPGTKVSTPTGLKAIEDVRVGDCIFNASGQDIVREVHKNEVRSAIRLKFADGRTIISSPEHLCFTRDQGWVSAAELRPGNSVVETTTAMRLLRERDSTEVFRRSPKAFLQHELLGEMADDDARREGVCCESGAPESQGTLETGTPVQVVSGSILSEDVTRGSQHLLQPELQFQLADDTTRNQGKTLQSRSYSQNRCQTQSLASVELAYSNRSKTPFGTNELDEQSRNEREGQSNYALPWHPSEMVRWPRPGINQTPANVIRSARQTMEGRACRAGCATPTRVTDVLLSRSSATREEAGDRSGRRNSPHEEVAGEGREESSILECARVDSVEVLERGHRDLERYRDANGALYFYDLSATRHPSFSVEGLLVHNCLKSFGSKTYQTFLTLFDQVQYKFVATATPSPNRLKELIHYAGFLGIMDTGLSLTRWFKRDPQKAGNLTLHPHKEAEFWLWVSTWATFLDTPSDLGHSDEGYSLPELKIHLHRLPVDHAQAGADSWGQEKMFRSAATSLSDAAREKRDSLEQRLICAKQIIDEHPDRHWLLWHTLENERHAIEKAIHGVTTVYGSQDLEEREQAIADFSDGQIRRLATKPSIAGSGCNFQRYCYSAVFLGLDYKFSDLIQACMRIHRFLQKHVVDIHLIYTESEDAIYDELMRKWAEHDRLRANMTTIMKTYGLNNARATQQMERAIGIERQVQEGDRFQMINNDSCVEMLHWPDNSIDLIVSSVPFSTHYEYSPSYNDLGHNDGDDGFFEQMDFLTPELHRCLKPGRIYALHCKDRLVYGSVSGLGMYSVNQFSDKCTSHMQKHGFIFCGRITVVTDVVRENNQTYRLGWSENAKDGTKMGVGSPEYVLLFRKLPSDLKNAYADVPVAKPKEEYTRARWQFDASPFWRSSGNRFLSPEEIRQMPQPQLRQLWREFNATHVYEFQQHVEIAEALEREGLLPASFMLLDLTANNSEWVWDDVVRMRTLNAEQSRKRVEQHICPLQIDIVDRLIERYSNAGELVFDPFAGIGTVPYCAILKGRRGAGCELSSEYWADAVGYCRAAETKVTTPTLFDFMEADNKAVEYKVREDFGPNGDATTPGFFKSEEELRAKNADSANAREPISPQGSEERQIKKLKTRRTSK